MTVYEVNLQADEESSDWIVSHWYLDRILSILRPTVSTVHTMRSSSGEFRSKPGISDIYPPSSTYIRTQKRDA